jgi:hypothetical protein
MTRAKFWKPGANEHREWTFAFGADGEPATVESFVYRGSSIRKSEEYLRYPVD